MKLRRLLAASAVALLLGPLGATAAVAAPANDTAAGAVVIDSLPATHEQVTTDATTDDLDASLNAMCGAPATNGSVWFRYADATGEGLGVDVSASGFSAGVMIVAGDPTTDGQLVACGPGGSSFRGEPGTEYWIMAFSDNEAVTGGNLVITFEALPAAPTASLTVEGDATAYRDGSLSLRGTYSCTNAYDAWVDGQVVQTVGRLKITGWFSFGPLECDGQTHGWDAVVTSDNGLFAGGKATSVSMAIACNDYECGFSEPVFQSLKVRRGR